MGEFPDQVNGIAVKLHKLAESKAVASAKHELHDAGEKLQHAMEAWHASVDAWVSGPHPHLEEARKRAFSEYRQLVERAHALIAQHRV